MKGAFLYYCHDKREEGELSRLTTERVAWTQTVNLPTDEPERAWRMMAHTILAQADLKVAAGIKATGRKLQKPVMAYSLAWHPDERPNREEMLDAALASMKALGIASHQAIIVAHQDEPHRHVHILLNRIDPLTGVAAKLGNSKLILSAWAEAYESGRGRVYCTERVENNARRKGLRPGQAAKRSLRMTRPEWELAASDRAAAAALRVDHAALFADQTADERAMEHRHQAESGRLFDARQMERSAVFDRHTAEAALTRHPEAAQAYDRIADMLVSAAPELAFTELTRDRSTFTRQDLARLVGRHTSGPEVFRAVMARLEAARELVQIGRDGRGRERFTTRTQQAIEQRMERHARRLAVSRAPGGISPKWGGRSLNAEQDKALRHVLTHEGLSAIVGFAGSGKSTLLDAARQSWEAAGYRVKGAALSGFVVDGLTNGAGIDSRTIHSRLHQWEQGQNMLTAKDVLVIDEAGMIGSRQMERILAHAVAAKAKVVLVGDWQQLQAIEAGGAFKAIVERIGAARMTTVRRQKQAWQQQATRDLAEGRAAEAVRRYEDAGMVHAHAKTVDALQAITAAWHEARTARPGQSQIILAHTRKDVRALNDMARERLRLAGQLGPDVIVQTEGGKRSFAIHDRISFLKNDRTLGVKNGTLGTIERVTALAVTVRLDGEAGKLVTFGTAAYAHIDHGYAATIHKSQGVTVDRAHVLASRGFDRHLVYVALSRHRERADLHWSAEAFGTRAQLGRTLSRSALKDTSLDYGTDAVAQQEARSEAAVEMTARITRRAKAFADREATPQGRIANARSLAGQGATPIELARLALDRRGRVARFRQQQATLRQWARKLAAAAVISVAVSRSAPAADRQAMLLKHSAETQQLAAVMRARHTIERELAKTARHALQALAASNWAAARKAAQHRAGIRNAFCATAEQGVRIDDEDGPGGIGLNAQPPGQRGPGPS